jgi:secreted trypsin-like serine protease
MTMNERPASLFSQLSQASARLRPLLLAFVLAGSSAALPADISTRIIGGVPSAEGDWPWMTAILHREISDPYLAQFCGGSLIHPSWVMTAAHCTFDEARGIALPPEAIDVMVGETDLTAGGERIPVVRIIRYPSYQFGVIYDDIALLELQTPSSQQPVRLPGPTFPAEFHDPVVPPGTTATTLGWGTTSTDSLVYPTLLQQVDVPIVDQATCTAAYASIVDVVETQVCAGLAEGGKDACQGDSGGPLVSRSAATGDKLVQVGITSLGLGCAQPDFYGIYTRVSKYSQWITGICSPTDRPAAPNIKLSVNGNLATVSFAPVAGATGYRLYWAPYPDMYPVFQLDIGTATSVSAILPSGTDLWVAVDPYNGNCLGAFSEIKPLFVP